MKGHSPLGSSPSDKGQRKREHGRGQASKPDARASIIKAARELFTTTGYSDTSPRDIMDRAKAGQGSFYHHFRSKRDLAAHVLGEIADELLNVGRTQLQTRGAPHDRVRSYLLAERDALNGCRVGRIAYDAGLNERRLREPCAHYFAELERLLTALYLETRADDPAASCADAAKLSRATLAIVQGGYVLSRIQKDESYLGDAVRGFLSVLAASGLK